MKMDIKKKVIGVDWINLAVNTKVEGPYAR
jgi:hypothetical protein